MRQKFQTRLRLVEIFSIADFSDKNQRLEMDGGYLHEV